MIFENFLIFDPEFNLRISGLRIPDFMVQQTYLLYEFSCGNQVDGLPHAQHRFWEMYPLESPDTQKILRKTL